jgi:flagellar biogenesis protein FliO
VNYWIGYNLIFTVVISAVVLYLGFVNDPKFIQLKEVLFDGNHKLKILVLIVIVLIIIGFMLLLVWLFYKLLYGILLKKLYRNYQELKKIDL